MRGEILKKEGMRGRRRTKIALYVLSQQKPILVKFKKTCADLNRMEETEKRRKKRERERERGEWRGRTFDKMERFQFSWLEEGENLEN